MIRTSTPLVILLLAIGCSSVEPRYGEATVSAAAPRAALSGTTWGDAPALELAPGCPGYLDPTQPAHVVHVSESLELHLRASSDAGPIALAVARGDEVRCDSDEGSGHAPSLSFTGPGDYHVYVAALRAPAELPYTLSVTAGADDAAIVLSDGSRDVSVTITSSPAGATVRDADGRVVGTTPAMFVVNVPAGAPTERSFVLDLAGHEGVTVTGSLATSALVLHGQLVEVGPAVANESASGPLPIRDYQSAALHVDVGGDCTIGSAEVEVALRHEYLADLRVVLETPWRSELVLQRHVSSNRRELRRTWTTSEPELRALVGRPGAGRWRLVVHDDAGADQGTLERFDLRLGCGSAPVVTTTTPAPTPTPTPTPTPNPNAGIPELPTHSDIVAVLARLRPNVERRCGQGGGAVRVYFTIAGSTGTVRSISTSGNAGASQQACVAQLVRGARFPRFRRGSLDVDYTYDLPGTPQQGNVINPWVSRP